MYVIAVASQKGGAGESTLSIHLAAEFAARGPKTLLLDLDPQGSASEWCNRRGDKLPPDVGGANQATLRRELDRARADGYELVVLDTAPHADSAALAAARASDLVVIPCRPSTLDVHAISATLDLCKLSGQPAIVVINAAPVRSPVTGESRTAIEALGGNVSPVVVHNRVAFQHCITDGRVAGEYEPGGAAATEISDLLADVLSYQRVDRSTASRAGRA